MEPVRLAAMLPEPIQVAMAALDDGIQSPAAACVMPAAAVAADRPLVELAAMVEEGMVEMILEQQELQIQVVAAAE